MKGYVLFKCTWKVTYNFKPQIIQAIYMKSHEWGYFDSMDEVIQ